jgi:hypothetical protein
MTRHAKLSGADLTRAIKGVQQAGLDIDRLEVNKATGQITIWPKGSGASPVNDPDAALDAWKRGQPNG